MPVHRYFNFTSGNPPPVGDLTVKSKILIVEEELYKAAFLQKTSKLSASCKNKNIIGLLCSGVLLSVWGFLVGLSFIICL